jgi:hypothetical protein
MKLFATIYMFICLFLSIFYNNIYFYGKSKSPFFINNSNPNNTNYNTSWFMYFPNQVYLLQFVFFLTSTISIIVCFKSDIKQASENMVHFSSKRSEKALVSLADISENRQKEYGSKLPTFFIYFLWITYTIVFSLSYLVTALFFSNEIANRFNLNNQNNIFNIWLILNVNVFNFIIMTIELAFTLIPVRLYHFYLPIIYYIFQFLVRINSVNFTNPEWNEVYCLIPIIFLIHVLGSLIYRLKFWLFSKILKIDIVALD